MVVATGLATEFGNISQLTETVQADPTPLQRRMAVLGRQLGVGAVTVAVLVSLIGWWFGNDLREMFMVGVSLAVAVVPEGLPAVVTMTMALGVRAMVRRRALLRRLQAAESLGAATVICTDKTGTLTQNQMTVTHIWLPDREIQVSGVGYEPAGDFHQADDPLDVATCPDLLQLLQTAVTCNHATLRQQGARWEGIGEPTEGALVVAGYKAALGAHDHSDDVAEFEFNSERKRMTIVRRHSEEMVAHVKGAPEVILDRCARWQVDGREQTLTPESRQQVMEAVETAREPRVTNVGAGTALGHGGGSQLGRAGRTGTDFVGNRRHVGPASRGGKRRGVPRQASRH